MTAQVVTAKDLIKHLADIVDEWGNIPVVTGSCTAGVFESVGQPSVLSVTPTKEAAGFQAYKYASPEDARRTKAAFIN